MAYTVTLYTFTKRPNSTKQPTGAGVQYNCTICDPTGILAPSIDLKLGDTSNPSVYNYAYISAWNRYYYIRDWYYINGIWRAQLQIDALASWKTQIGSNTAYVARSSAAMNGRIGDSTYPILAGETTQTVSNNANPFATSYANGWFIVGIINADSQAIGGVSYYGMTNAEFQTFRSLMFGDISWAGTITTIETSLVKMIANPFQYISSVMWVPFDPGFANTVHSISFGYWTLTCDAHRVTYPRAGGTVTIQVPKHPLALSRGYYLLCEPYSSYYLDFPPFGAFSVPADALVDSDLITCHWDCDIITGRGRLQLQNDQNRTFNIMQGQIGVPVQIASAAPDVGGLFNQMMDAMSVPANVGEGTAAVSSSIQAAVIASMPEEAAAQLAAVYGPEEPVTLDTSSSSVVKSFASNVVSAVVQHMFPMQSLGSNGGFMSGYYPIRLIGNFARIADDDNADRGRPLCENRQLNTIPGYIQLAEAHLQIPCTLPELDEINTRAAAGFFYE